MSSVMAYFVLSQFANTPLSQPIWCVYPVPCPAPCEDGGTGVAAGVADGLDPPKPCAPDPDGDDELLEVAAVAPTVVCLMVPDGLLEVLESEPVEPELSWVLVSLLLFLDPTTPPTTATMIMTSTAIAMMMIPFLVV